MSIANPLATYAFHRAISSTRELKLLAEPQGSLNIIYRQSCGDYIIGSAGLGGHVLSIPRQRIRRLLGQVAAVNIPGDLKSNTARAAALIDRLATIKVPGWFVLFTGQSRAFCSQLEYSNHAT